MFGLDDHFVIFDYNSSSEIVLIYVIGFPLESGKYNSKCKHQPDLQEQPSFVFEVGFFCFSLFHDDLFLSGYTSRLAKNTCFRTPKIGIFFEITKFF